MRAASCADAAPVDKRIAKGERANAARRNVIKLASHVTYMNNTPSGAKFNLQECTLQVVCRALPVASPMARPNPSIGAAP